MVPDSLLLFAYICGFQFYLSPTSSVWFSKWYVPHLWPNSRPSFLPRGVLVGLVPPPAPSCVYKLSSPVCTYLKAVCWTTTKSTYLKSEREDVNIGKAKKQVEEEAIFFSSFPHQDNKNNTPIYYKQLKVVDLFISLYTCHWTLYVRHKLNGFKENT